MVPVKRVPSIRGYPGLKKRDVENCMIMTLHWLTFGIGVGAMCAHYCMYSASQREFKLRRYYAGPGVKGIGT